MWSDEFEVQSHQIEKIRSVYRVMGLSLMLTCSACPEQYDVYKGEEQVGYYRLRHGYFRINYPECGDDTIYEAEPLGDGIFEPSERAYYLLEAMHILLNILEKDGDRKV